MLKHGRGLAGAGSANFFGSLNVSKGSKSEFKAPITQTKDSQALLNKQRINAGIDTKSKKSNLTNFSHMSTGSFFQMLNQPFQNNNYLQKAFEMQQMRLESMTMKNVDLDELQDSINQA